MAEALRDIPNNSNVWVYDYRGPRCCTLDQRYENGSTPKVLLLFHGEPELHNAADIYLTKAACYRAAAQRKQKEAFDAMKLATEWLTLADKDEAATESR